VKTPNTMLDKGFIHLSCILDIKEINMIIELTDKNFSETVASARSS
jgi:hypothetical protein